MDETAIQLDSARNYGQTTGHKKAKILRNLLISFDLLTYIN